MSRAPRKRSMTTPKNKFCPECGMEKTSHAAGCPRGPKGKNK